MGGSEQAHVHATDLQHKLTQRSKTKPPTNSTPPEGASNQSDLTQANSRRRVSAAHARMVERAASSQDASRPLHHTGHGDLLRVVGDEGAVERAV